MGRAVDGKDQMYQQRAEASQRAAENLLNKLGVRLEQLDRWIDDPPDGETFIRSIQFKIDAGWEGGILVIVRAVIGGEKMVGFHGADSFAESLSGLVSRLGNGTLKWRKDVPYEER